MAGTYSEMSFEEIGARRDRALGGVRETLKRIPGTPEEKKLRTMLEAYGRFEASPKAELRAEGNHREVVLNGDRVRVSVEVDPARGDASGFFRALSSAGAFHPATAKKLVDLGGLPVKGTLRYVLFLDRIVERFEVTAVRRGAVEDSAFEVPEGFKKVPLAGFSPAQEPEQ